MIADRVPPGTGRQRVGARVGGEVRAAGPTGSGPAAAAMTRSRPIYEVVKGKSPKRRWALDADLAGAFDRIAHDHILTMLGTFPARGMVAQWLKAGVVEQGRLHRTEEGTPQGGVVSPVLLNVALHGMEQAAGVRYCTTGSHAGKVSDGLPGSDQVRRRSRRPLPHQAGGTRGQGTARRAGWRPGVLAFNEDKTRVVTLDEGFDFLGFNVRRYGTKPLIKPSKAAQRRIRERLRTELRSLRGSNAQAVIKRLNPIIRGWAAYYRTQVSSEVFDALDHYLWRLTCKWARYSHQNKPKSWVVRQVLRQVQQVQAGPVGVRRPQKRRLHAQVLLDPDPPTPDRQARGVTRRPRARRLLGQATAQERPCRSTRPPRGSSTPRTVAARSAEASLFTVEDRPQNPREWETMADHHPHTRSSRSRRGNPARSEEADTPSRTRRMPHGHGPALHNAYEPSGLA